MLAIAGGKGGCGKTTTAWRLARALADRGARPLVADADVAMPDLHVLAGVPRRPGLDAVDVRRRTPPAPPAGTGTGADGPASPQDPVHHAAGVRVIPAGDADEARARTLSAISARGEPTLLDTPAGAGRDVAAPLRAADATLLVTTPTRESLADAAKTAAVARRLDAPPVGTFVVRSAGGVDPRPLLDCVTLAHVPELPEPAAPGTAAGAYDRMIRQLSRRNI